MQTWSDIQTEAQKTPMLLFMLLDTPTMRGYVSKSDQDITRIADMLPQWRDRILKQAAIQCLEDGASLLAYVLIQFYGVVVSKEEAACCIMRSLEKKNIDAAYTIKARWDIIPTKEMQQKAEAGVISCLEKGQIDKARSIKKDWGITLTKNIMQRGSSEAARLHYNQGNNDVVRQLIEDWGAEDPALAVSTHLSP